MAEYRQLEPGALQKLVDGDGATFTTGTDVSFLTTSTFMFMLFFAVIIGAAFYEYVLVGIHRMRASEAGIRESNEIFRRTTLGLLGVFGMFLLISTLNSSILSGDITLDGLRLSPTSSSGVTTGTITQTGSGGTTKTCESPEAVITKLSSQGGLCGGTTCRALTGCNYQQYNSFIDQAIGNDPNASQLRKMIIVTMCKESSGNKNASNQNQNGTYDCGLMQINQTGPCDASILDPQTNISRGVAKMKEKIAYTTRTYTNIPVETGPFSSYNCCANGTKPNDPSNDCTTANGFPFQIPKWACPINPGDSSFNMCSVKSYACELSVCMGQL